jgi:hypothetical protein
MGPTPLKDRRSERVGDSTHWVVRFEAFAVAWIADADGRLLTKFYFEVALRSGEVLESETISSEHVQHGR